MIKLGILADIHGDLMGFQAALKLLQTHGVDQIVCAGDILDRGSGADEIVNLIQQHRIACIKGNHEHTVLRFQKRWRESEHPEKLAKLGRIISDETVVFIETLPESLPLTIDGLHILMAHGTPWSDVLGVFPDSRPSLFEQLNVRHGEDTDILILGHTHQPMHIKTSQLHILNAGSVYGVTIRDSHSCAILELPQMHFTVYDLQTSEPIHLEIVDR